VPSLRAAHRHLQRQSIWTPTRHSGPPIDTTRLLIRHASWSLSGLVGANECSTSLFEGHMALYPSTLRASAPTRQSWLCYAPHGWDSEPSDPLPLVWTAWEDPCCGSTWIHAVIASYHVYLMPEIQFRHPSHPSLTLLFQALLSPSTLPSLH
jgi:hypothetical protein